MKSLKSKKNKLTLTLICYLSREAWLGKSRKLQISQQISIRTLQLLTSALI